MQKIALIPISEAGAPIAQKLQTLRADTHTDVIGRTEVDTLWAHYDAFVFIGAMGICVRTIAPFAQDKHTDPAVVCIDSLGKYVIPVLSGHVGGANELATGIATALGATPVITTQSDNAGLWALDTLAQRFGWAVAHRRGQTGMNDIVTAFVRQEPTALLMDVHDEGTEYLERTLPQHVTRIADIAEARDFRLLIIVSPFVHDLPRDIPTIQYIPRVLTVGIGLAHQAPADTVLPSVDQCLLQHRICREGAQFATIDIKADEPVIRQLQAEGHAVRTFAAHELAQVTVPTPSPTVAKHVGTPSVCEAAALLATNHGRLLVPKVKGKDFTLAVAIGWHHLQAAPAPGTTAQSAPTVPVPDNASTAPGGHIEIVGAGPGDPDLVSVRGRRMLERADLILYAGSLVPKELTRCHKPGAMVQSSASMALEEQCRLMKQFYDRGLFVVRLHTGDPCIFGAIQEQMAFFDAHHMSYHITPGISSFLAAAAELRSQFTIPERTQTIILTRGEGRTAMPERERLRLLAAHQSTMCIFLSATLAAEVQAELLAGGYAPDTPVAVCYKLTWPEQRIFRGQLKDLARLIDDNHLTLTTMIVVGDAIDNREGLSRLYDSTFSHLFRSGKD